MSHTPANKRQQRRYFRNVLAALVAVMSLVIFPQVQGAVSPQDQYVVIYNLIEQAETYHQIGLTADTLARYRQAHAALKQFQSEHPDWNPRIVNFRLDYLASRIASLASRTTVPAPLPAAAPMAATQSAPAVKTGAPTNIATPPTAVHQQASPRQAEQPRFEIPPRKMPPAPRRAEDTAQTPQAVIKAPDLQKELSGHPPGTADQTGIVPTIQPRAKVPDLGLVRPSRTNQAAAASVVGRYQPAPSAATRSQVSDATARRVAASQAKVNTTLRPALRLADAQSKAAADSRRNHWLLAGVLALAVALLLVVWWSVRRQQAQALLPVQINTSEAGDPLAACLPSEEDSFASTIGADLLPPVPFTHDTLRAVVGPHLAQLLRDRLVEKLLSQRATLLDAQQVAAREVAELEQRLEKIHAPLRDRLRAYETRIAELKRQLAAKGEENRTLTETKISLVKQQLETKGAKTVAQQS